MKSERRQVSYIILLIISVILIAIFIIKRSSPLLLSPQTVSQESYLMGLIGNNGEHLDEEFDAGIRVKLFSLSWRRLYPDSGIIDAAYLAEELAKLNALYDTGFSVVLNFGMHDSPGWIHENYENTYYVNQYGESYIGEPIDSGNINFIFNTDLRPLLSSYIESVFQLFGTDFIGVRVGGGRYGELTYPPDDYEGNTNLYWAFDDYARRQSPVSGWIPGEPSPDGEAEQFLNWYLDALVEYQQWQVETVREIFPGSIMILYPSWGIRAGEIDDAIRGNLDGSTWAEYHGEIQRGVDFERQVMAITDANVLLTTTWLDADSTNDSGEDSGRWSPVKYLAMLASNHPLELSVFGENTGWGSYEDMRLSVLQMQEYQLIGMLWFREEQLFSGEYATLDNYREIIELING